MSVRHPRLPFGRFWLPILSVVLYGLAWVARVALSFFPPERLVRYTGEHLPVDPRTTGRLLTALTWASLCSGSYVLVDVSLPEERLRVKVRTV